MDMNNPVRWFEIYVQDMPRAKRFYEGVLGVTLTLLEGPAGAGDMEMWAFPMGQETYGASGTLVRMPGMPPGVGGTLVYFACEDCAVEAARAVQFGGRIEQAKSSIGPYGHIALLMDTEGNRVGLHSMQ
jgi:predicted enzyme related to lactoylglutathione lyase